MKKMREQSSKTFPKYMNYSIPSDPNVWPTIDMGEAIKGSCPIIEVVFPDTEWGACWRPVYPCNLRVVDVFCFMLRLGVLGIGFFWGNSICVFKFCFFLLWFVGTGVEHRTATRTLGFFIHPTCNKESPGGFKQFFIANRTRGNDPNLTVAYFSNGLVQAPTRNPFNHY